MHSVQGSWAECLLCFLSTLRTQSIGNGTLHPNFMPINTSHGFSVERYAMAVSNELLWALDGLVEESEC